jgi:DNA-binding response OmpR family regulator
MSLARAPRVIILFSDPDVLTTLSGAFRLKNYEVFKASALEECISILEKENGKVDVIVLDAKLAADRSAKLILSVRRMNQDVKILAIAGDDTAKTRILDYGADEFALKPMSTENVADKVFNLIARGRRVREY